MTDISARREPEIPTPSLTFILGGVRAGKSARALALARQYSARQLEHASVSGVLFVATAQAFDAEMERRIAAHKAERPAHWHTVEAAVNVSASMEHALETVSQDVTVVVIDCLTLWTSNLLLALDSVEDAELQIAAHVQELIRTVTRYATVNTPSGLVQREWIVVSNEVGLGVVPPTLLGRVYRDALGRANQIVAAAATSVSLMVAGLELRIK